MSRNGVDSECRQTAGVCTLEGTVETFRDTLRKVVNEVAAEASVSNASPATSDIRSTSSGKRCASSAVTDNNTASKRLKNAAMDNINSDTVINGVESEEDHEVIVIDDSTAALNSTRSPRNDHNSSIESHVTNTVNKFFLQSVPQKLKTSLEESYKLQQSLANEKNMVMTMNNKFKNEVARLKSSNGGDAAVQEVSVPSVSGGGPSVGCSCKGATRVEQQYPGDSGSGSSVEITEVMSSNSAPAPPPYTSTVLPTSASLQPTALSAATAYSSTQPVPASATHQPSPTDAGMAVAAAAPSALPTSGSSNVTHGGGGGGEVIDLTDDDDIQLLMSQHPLPPAPPLTELIEEGRTHNLSCSVPPTAPRNKMELCPKPMLTVAHNPRGIVLHWHWGELSGGGGGGGGGGGDVAATEPSNVAAIRSYQLYVVELDKPPGARPDSPHLQWKRIGSVRALPLPMACTLSSLSHGRYYFTIRGKDEYNRLGHFSNAEPIDYHQ